MRKEKEIRALLDEGYRFHTGDHNGFFVSVWLFHGKKSLLLTLNSDEFFKKKTRARTIWDFVIEDKEKSLQAIKFFEESNFFTVPFTITAEQDEKIKIEYEFELRGIYYHKMCVKSYIRDNFTFDPFVPPEIDSLIKNYADYDIRDVVKKVLDEDEEYEYVSNEIKFYLFNAKYKK